MTTSKRLAHVKLLCAAAVIALGASTAGLAYVEAMMIPGSLFNRFVMS